MASYAIPGRSWPPRSRASGTSLTQVFGVGPVIAGTVIGDVGDVARFPGRDHFASYNGTAPVEVSSGNRKIRRLSLRGNRRINHAIHMAAITQLRHKHSEGRSLLRSRKRPRERPVRRRSGPSSARSATLIFGRLQADARQAREKGPGGQPGNGSDSSAGQLSTPNASSSDQPLPRPDTTIRPGTHRRHASTVEAGFKENSASYLTATAKRTRYGRHRELWRSSVRVPRTS